MNNTGENFVFSASDLSALTSAKRLLGNGKHM